MIIFVFGTRPEIIKLSPVIRELKKRKVKFILIHTNQHFSKNMDEVFFKDLNLPKPDYNLNLGSLGHGAMVGSMLISLEKLFIKIKPKIVIVQGDTNSTLSGGLAAAKLGIKVAHIEAGLRSYDRRMPEELNRTLVDHLSDILFAPTVSSAKNLSKEGIDNKKIELVGNTITDALNYAKNKTSTQKLPEGFKPFQYLLATIHRQENVDDFQNLTKLIALLQTISQHYSTSVILPIHPRTNNLISKHKINTNGLTIIDPISYFPFIHLLSNAKAVITDSGGIQEEACILQVPCITVRNNTERPETVEVGANVLVGNDTNKAIVALDRFFKSKNNWENPFGDGKAAERILDKLT